MVLNHNHRSLPYSEKLPSEVNVNNIQTNSKHYTQREALETSTFHSMSSANAPCRVQVLFSFLIVATF